VQTNGDQFSRLLNQNVEIVNHLAKQTVQVVSMTTLLTTIYYMCASFYVCFPFDENVYCVTCKLKLCSN
jgi:hypothetical protein